MKRRLLRLGLLLFAFLLAGCIVNVLVEWTRTMIPAEPGHFYRRQNGEMAWQMFTKHQPLWSSTWLAAFVYAAILCVLFVAPGIVKRTIRHRRGLCTPCSDNFEMSVNLRGRIRSVTKWSVALVTVLLVVMWVGSKWRTVGIQVGLTQIYFLSGGLHIYQHELPPRFSRNQFLWSETNSLNTFTWWFARHNFQGTWVIVPGWLIVLFPACATCVVWWRERKPKHNSCPKCGYSRTGLPANRACPECGTAVNRATSH